MNWIGWLAAAYTGGLFVILIFAFSMARAARRSDDLMHHHYRGKQMLGSITPLRESHEEFPERKVGT